MKSYRDDIAKKLQKAKIGNTYNEIISKNYSERGNDREYFHYRDETKDQSNFRSAEEMYEEFQKNGFVSGDCTKNASWINFLSNSLNIPSKVYHIFLSADEAHVDNSIFTGVDYEYHLGKGARSMIDTVVVSPVLMEFDSKANIVNKPVLHLGNMNLSSISSNWFEEQIYQTWLKRLKK